ncbi:HAD-IIB family hydrolase [Metamycoplasma neophronis]|uniref:HAD family phosphatase n=1 Tax=Metamycoplasma neophronis TaxID=872983 RepID=A0ABY2Z3U0_9BACT|nr:HAD family hydrolase [Metamycoplasma neophronis]TPR53695.1 HAD family phosphatase [Metamycoplasma neophronis]
MNANNGDELLYKTTNDLKPVIFSDVDGTIYRHFELKDETVKDIHWAIKNGADFNICTGNPIQERMEVLGDTLNARYIIGSSGAQIYDREAKKIIKSWHISNEAFLKLINIAKQNNIQTIFWDNDNYYYLFEHEQILNTICSYHFVNQNLIKSVPKLWQGEFIEPVKIEFYSLSDFETESGAKVMYELIKELNEVTMIPTNCNVEISPLGITKGSAVQWMVDNVYKKDNVTVDDVMTIGDSNNDVPMLQLAHYSYGMANASGNVFDVCKFYTSSVEQNGLGEAIIDYLYRYKNIVKKYLLRSYFNDQGDNNE